MGVFSCEKSETEELFVRGIVTGGPDSRIISSAFIFHENLLLAETDFNGFFQISGLEPGSYSFLCSSLGYADQTSQVEVSGKLNTDQDFHLYSGQAIGTIYGELHDRELYDEQLKNNPALGHWTPKELFDGVSGATKQSKTLGFDVPHSSIFIGDSLIATTDEYGQFTRELQCGTYPIQVTGAGYIDSTRVVRIKPDSVVFANFILERDGSRSE